MSPNPGFSNTSRVSDMKQIFRMTQQKIKTIVNAQKTLF